MIEMDVQSEDQEVKRKLTLNIENNITLRNDANMDIEDASKDKSPSPSPGQDDFLTIVPKPTLLSKEKAKKRLQAFSSSKLSSYLSSKKQKLAEPKEKKVSEEKTTTVEDEVKSKEASASPTKKSLKRAKHVDVARETVEAIEKCKLEESNLFLLAKNESKVLAKINYLDKKRRKMQSNKERAIREERERQSGSQREFGFRARSRSIEKRASSRNKSRNSFSREGLSHERRVSVPRLHGKDKDKKTWSDYEDDFADNPDRNDVKTGIVDIRRMLLFNSVCYNFNPYQYKKLDGSVAEISAQYLRFTVKASPLIAYCPNPSNIKGTYFQRKETFSIIPKPQQECLMNLISQAQQAKPIAPHKPPSVRNWYSKDYLVERQPEAESVNSDVSEDSKGSKSSKREKSKKKKSRNKHDKEEKSKHHKTDKHKRKESRRDLKKSTTNAEGSHHKIDDQSVKDKKKRTRTDSQKSDNNSNNSTIDDKSLSNHLPSRSNEVSSQGENVAIDRKPKSSATSSEKQVSEHLKSQPIHSTTSASSSNKSKSEQKSKSKTVQNVQDQNEHRRKSDTPKDKQEKPGKEVDVAKEHLKEPVGLDKRFNCKTGVSPRISRFSEIDHKSYSKLSASIPPHPHHSTNLAPTKIYNIENDCIDSKVVKTSIETAIIEQLDDRKTDIKLETANLEQIRNQSEQTEINDNKSKSLSDHFDPVTEIAEIRPLKEIPIEKLKTKPSELYSPTLQSSTSVTSESDIEVPDTNEYKSHWESEEEYSALQSSKAMNNSWESEDEEYEVLERVIEKPKELTQRSLEMPLNINISWSRSQNIVVPKEKLETKASLLFEDLDCTSSWDADMKQTTSFEVNPAVDSYGRGNYDTLPMIDKPNLEDEYIQFMSSVSSIEESSQRKHRYSTSSSSTSSSSSSSSSESSSSSNEEKVQKQEETLETETNKDKEETEKVATAISSEVAAENSPVCKVDSTSSPAITQEENKLDLSPKKIPSIVLAKKNPLVGCNLFKDEDSDNEDTNTTAQVEQPIVTSEIPRPPTPKPEIDTPLPEAQRQSPSPGKKRSESSPKRNRGASPPRRLSPAIRRYSPKRDRCRSPRRRDASPRRKDGSPRKDSSPRSAATPRNKDSRDGSLKRDSPRRAPSPKHRDISPTHRDISPKRRDLDRKLSPRYHGSPRHRGEVSPRRRSPKHKDSSRDTSPRHDSRRSPRLMLRDSSRDTSPRHDLRRSPRHKDSSRDASPRHDSRRSPRHKDSSRDTTPRHDSRHRSPKHRDRSPRPIDLPRHRDYDRDRHRDGDISRNRDDRYRDRKYRDGSPRYRDSPSRYSPSRRRTPPRHRYSPKRDRSPRYRDRSPRRRSNSPPRRVYSRSRSKERKHESITQALHRLAGMEYDPPKSPAAVNSPMDGYIRGVADSTISDEQLMQNRGVGSDFNSTQSPIYFNQPYKMNSDGTSASPKRIPLDDRINQVLGIDAPKSMDNAYQTDHGQYYNQMYYDQYGVNMPNHDYDHGNYKNYNRQLVDVNRVSTKVLQVGNVLQVVPTEQQQMVVSNKKKDAPIVDATQLQVDSSQKFVSVGNMLQIVPTTELPTDNTEQVAVDLSCDKKKAEEILQIQTSERKVERDKRRLERDRRRKEKDLKRKDREKRKQLKIKMKSEEMIKKALLFDVADEVEEDGEKLPTVSIVTTGTRISKGILVVHDKNQKREDVHIHKQKKGVKFADGVLPGEGTSPSGGEELSSPPPFSKIPKEKRYTKTKKPKKAKQLKKKIKVKIIRKSKKKDDDENDDDNLPPPSPPPGSPPPHIFPPRMKPIYNPNFYQNYQFSAVNCRPMPEASHHPFPTLPNMQYPIQPHLASPMPLQPHLGQPHLGQPLPIPSHLGQPPPALATLHPASLHLHASRLPPKSLNKPIDKGL